MKNVSAGIFIKDDFVLIAKRGQHENLSGHWEFPGGKQEPQETIFECLEREIQEELNVRCKAKEIFCESTYNYKNGAIKLIAIFSDLLDNTITLKVHEKYKWVSISELLDFDLAPADIPIAEKLIEYSFMKTINELRPGNKVNNEQLASIFQCGTQGGMRKSKKTNSLVIVSNHIKSIYDDRWNGDILYYTGMGTVGDQSFEKSQNKTLYYSDSNGISVYLFEVFEEKHYTFMGKVALAGKPFYEEQPDATNQKRKVCVFPLKLVDGKSPVIDKKILDKVRVAKEKKVRKLDDNTIRELAAQGKQKAGTRETKTTQFVRNVAVAEYAKRVANGVCQLCGQKAPFDNKNGEPYLETHHIDWLSEGGSDTIENTAALCPNCHRKMHIVNDEKDKEYLKNVVK